VTGDAATELLREEIARWLAWAYGGDDYAEQRGSSEHWLEMADQFLADVPSVRRLLAVEQRARDAMTRIRADEQEITRNLSGIETANYGPSEWRLHGAARGRRMAMVEITDALGGDGA
jgi:hypothetical protein